MTGILSGPKPSRAWLARANAWVLLANALLGLSVQAGAIFADPAPSMLVPVLGVLSGVLALRGYAAGRWGALAFYALQAFSYYPYAATWRFSIKAGLSLGAVAHLDSGVVVVNLLALALLAAWTALPGAPAAASIRVGRG
jgi:hypothetical protein